MDEHGAAARVQEGNPDHRHTDGALCAKVNKYTERSYHPERVLTPLKRIGPKAAASSPPRDRRKKPWLTLPAPDSPSPRAPEAILPYSYAGTMGMVVQGE